MSVNFIENNRNDEKNTSKNIFADSNELRSPSRSQIIALPFDNGALSPTKRGIIRHESNIINPIDLSPIKTPNGRAGLRSPKKRNTIDLNHSARKRAVKSSVYSKLLEAENQDIGDEYLDQHDRSLAEAIIKASRDEEQKLYGSDVELEEDLTTKKKRGRPRGSTKAKKDISESLLEIEQIPKTRKRNKSHIEDTDDIFEGFESDDINSDEYNDDDSDDEYVEKSDKGVKSRGNIYEEEKEEEDEEEEELEEEDDDLDILESETEFNEEVTVDDVLKEPREGKRKRGRPRTRPIEPPRVKRKYIKAADKEPIIKRKVGRPSKSEEVIGKVKSIFQMDDEEFFQENKQSSSPIKLSPQKPESVPIQHQSLSLLDLNQTTNTSIPLISGIEEQEKKIPAKKDSDIAQFIPLPIPRINDDGDIIDSEFIDKYIPSLDVSNTTRGKLLDEKSFFLEGSEGYFEQHSIRTKPSSNSLSQLAPVLDYDEYHSYIQISNLIRFKEKQALLELHKSLYHQWCFELSQGFNLNFYGVGSKIKPILDFVQNYLPEWYDNINKMDDDFPNILVVNGYNPTVKFKRVLQDIVTSIIPQEKKHKDKIKFPKHVSETVPFLMNYIAKNRMVTEDFIRPKLVLVIHNIDGESFRDDKTQNLLSLLCSLPEVWLISSTDNINISLLWDLFRLKNYNFLWHDLTTYDSYEVEMSFRDVLSMGKSKKFVGNKGAKYVLSSLTTNARNLYKILLGKQLDILKSHATTKAARTGLRGSIKFAVDFKGFYTACLEEFVTSNEISFRTILGEFVEHRMCNLTKDDSGAEVVFIPFSFDEMQKLLDEEFN